MVTMKDIAKIAGVSVQTVSNVVNNRGSQISEATKNKILKLVEKYNYRPSRIARSLRRGSTRNIGLVVPDMVFHPFYPKLFDIIESRLIDKGYNILVFNTRENVEREKRAVDELLENKVNGIIFVRIVQRNDYLKRLSRNIPIVACLRAFEYFDVPSVLTDNKKIGYLATDYLIKMGHIKILHLAGNEDLLAHKERKIGYIKALEGNSIAVDKRFIRRCDYKEEDLYRDILKDIDQVKDFTAVFAYNDIVAVQCIKALRLRGYRIPEDISVIGVDNLKIGKLIDPSLTTIEQPIEDICEASIKLLVEAIENGSNPAERSKEMLLCDPKLIERESVRKL